MSSQNENQQAIEKFKLEVQNELTRVYGNPSNLNSNQIGVVQLLYTKYFDRFVNDNNRIWYTGNLFIPLSLAGLIGIGPLSLTPTIILGVSSIFLMLCWVLVAENHRAFQTRAQVVTEAIESYLGLTIKGGKLAPHWALKWKLFGVDVFTVQHIRWQMLIVVIVIWTLAVAYKACLI
jgi:hypothetical protein